MGRAMLAGLLAAGMVLVGCSGKSTAEADAELCTALTELSDQLQTMGSLVAGGGARQALQVQKESIDSAADAAEEAAEGVQQSVEQQISAAEESFDDAVEAIPGDAPLAEAAAAYDAAARTFTTTAETALGELGCD